MPSKFTTRDLRGNSYYHVYNKAILGKDIFIDRADYEKFLFYLYIYTADPSEIEHKYTSIPKRLINKNLSQEIFVIAYCLMPDHFHLLLKQRSPDAIPKLVKQVVNAYITYFNKKYGQKGRLFNGRYQSVRVESEYLLVQMVRFVHLNPINAKLTHDLKLYQWSSYTNPMGLSGIINRFNSKEEWEKFHLDVESYEASLPKLENLTID